MCVGGASECVWGVRVSVCVGGVAIECLCRGPNDCLCGCD